MCEWETPFPKKAANTPDSQLKKIPQDFRRSQPDSEGWSAVAPRDRVVGRSLQVKVATRQGRPLDPSCQLHGFVQLEDICQRRHNHLGNQQTVYPTHGPDMPEYEPRGCPRGASFSWYIYSPLRVKYSYVRGALCLALLSSRLTTTIAGILVKVTSRCLEPSFTIRSSGRSSMVGPSVPS